jgi:hypothetical protein
MLLKRVLSLGILPFFLLGSALAQFTTVTGTVIDPHGVPYALGTITPLIVSSGTPTLNGQPYFPPTQAVGLDKTGTFSFNIADNTQLQPAGTKWNFTVCSAVGTVQPAIGTGSQCFTLAAPITITGATQSISAQLNAIALALTVPIGAGGPACPNGPNQVQYDNGGVCAGIANVASGSLLASQGTGTVPTMQTKPYYDARDWGITQDGTTDDSTALTNLLNSIGGNTATILFTGPTSQESLTYPPNVTVQFQKAGQFKPVSSTTPLGGAAFVQGQGASNVNVLTNTCSVTLTGTVAGNAIIFMENHFYTAATIAFGSVTDTQGGHYLNLVQQNFNLSSVNTAWAHSNIAGGTVTISVPYKDNLNAPVNVANGCIAWEISGMGPVIAAESALASYEIWATPTTTMSAGPISTSAGSLVIGFGGQSYLNETCTQGAGFTQPAGSAGSVGGGSQPITGYGMSLCAQYKVVSPGGNQTPTQTITSDPASIPLNKYWSYAAISVIPSSSVINIQGSIEAPPQQIFTNALPGQGSIDLTGNTILDKVYAEWWGASPQAAPAVNTPALQAAINGAYGTNRANGSQANEYNRELRLLGTYNINGTLTANHMNGFFWNCQERFACGFNQSAANTSILTTTTGGTYGAFQNILWATNVSQNISHPLVDLNYTGAGGADLATQFVDFLYNTFQGNGVAAIGLRIAASGGAAQGSNITNYNNAFANFTEAGYMIGAGSGCSASTFATNAISFNIINGDFQGNNAYGIEWFGAGSIKLDSTTFENGFGAQTNEGIQAGYDICGQTAAAGEQFEVDNVRSESLFTLGGAGPYVVKNSFNVDQAFVLGPGTLPKVGETIQGSQPGGHGVYYTVTGAGTWTGIGYPSDCIRSSSGSGTTIVNANQFITGSVTSGIFLKGETITQTSTGSTATLLNAVQGTLNIQMTTASGSPDNSHTWVGGTSAAVYTPTSAPATAGYTVNAWSNWYASIISGTGANEYGIVTSNTANTFTVAGGWLTDFGATVPVVNPDSTSCFLIEPQWGMQTSNNGVTWAAITKKISGLALVDGFFVPGLQVTFNNPQLMRGLQVTRSDWNGGAGTPDGPFVNGGLDDILAGTPSGGPGNGSAGLNPLFVRPWKFSRNGITETLYPTQKVMGTAINHYIAGSVAGVATVDIYTGGDPNTGTKNGRYFVENNSSGSPFYWYFNSDGTLSVPGSVATSSGPVSGTWQCTNVTPVTVSANVATDQNLMACTIPAGTLNSASKTLRIYASGIYSTPAASTSVVTLKAKLCTVSGCGAGTVITPINIASAALGAITATNDPFNLAAYSTTQTTGAASAYEAHGNLTIDISALASAAEAVYADNNTATVGTIDSTAQLFLQITIAFSNASASNSATERQLIVDSVN